jgi:catechol 2,3-dioxygenase-like lactoylglutathione lyase family enzyme
MGPVVSGVREELRESIMPFPRTHIYLGVEDVEQSSSFYEALLGGPPSSRDAGVRVFELDAPPLVLTLENRGRTGVSRAHSRAHAFALVVLDPEHVGKAAIALRRAGARLRLQDEGIEARDPDGNTWKIRFVPWAKARAVVPIPEGAVS